MVSTRRRDKTEQAGLGLAGLGHVIGLRDTGLATCDWLVPGHRLEGRMDRRWAECESSVEEPDGSLGKTLNGNWLASGWCPRG